MTNSRSQFTIHYSPFTILPLIALSFAFNLHALAANNLWEDEIFTAIFASRSPAEVIRWTANDIHPPLYYLLAGAFTRLTVPLGVTQEPTPVSDWLWRFPSVIAGVLTVAVTYRLAFWVSGVGCRVSEESHLPRNTQDTSRLTAISAALLLCLAPIVVKYSQEARMHALFMFLSALSTWLFFRAMARPQSWFRWLAFALATTANLYTMYFGFLILAAQASYLGFWILDFALRASGGFTIYATRNTQRASRLIGFSASVLLAFLLYTPWWPILFNILRRRAAVGAIEGGVGSPLTFISGVVRALGPLPEPVAGGFLLLFLVGLILLARKNWPMAAFASLWLILPVALPILLGDPRALQFRYAFVLPIYLIVIAYAAVRVSEWANGRIVNQPPTLQPSNPPTFQPFGLSLSRRPPMGRTKPSNILTYLTWILATFSLIAVIDVYNQVKPNWRDAAAYLDAHTTPNDLILIGPLWDEGRFIDYYYRGQAQLLTPAALVTNIQERTETLRATGGRVWAVNRFTPTGLAAVNNIVFSGGVVISEPQLAVYEPVVLTEVALNLARQAVDAAYPWAAEMEAQAVLNPDPRTAQAGALRALGDALVAAGRPEKALEPYQTAVAIFPGWVNGFIALAETYETVGNLQAAAEVYRQAVDFNLKWQGPEADEAAALVGARQWAAAVEKYHQIIEK
jgi:tetratricopeptide (TPR) repeat protein